MKLLYFQLTVAVCLPMTTSHNFAAHGTKSDYALKQKVAQLAKSPKIEQELQAPQQAVQYTPRVVSARTGDLMQDADHSTITKSTKPANQKQPTRIPGEPTIGQDFLAADYRETGQYGPSAEGSVGLTQFLHCNKGRLRTFLKSTGEPDGMLNLTLDRFFAPILHSDGFTADPGCVYDPWEQRWYIICDNPNGGVMLAISDNGTGSGDPITPETVWHYILVDVASDPDFDFAPILAFFDYTTIGFDQNYIYCSVDVAQSPGSDGASANALLTLSSAAYVIPKVPAVTGGTPVINAFRNLVNPSTYQGAVYKWPVINYDENPTSAFFVGTNLLDLLLNDFYGIPAAQFLAYVVDLTASPMTINKSNPLSLAVEPYVGTIPVQPLGTPASHMVDPVIEFINCEAHIRDNQLFLIHGIGTDDTGASISPAAVDRNSVRYYQFDVTDTSAPALINMGTLFDSTSEQTSFMTPAWISNEEGQLILGATQCSPTAYLDAIVAQVDPTTFVVTGSLPYTTSTNSYNATEDWEYNPYARWGDHTRVSLDPADGLTFWVCQQWCSDTDTWGLQVAEVTAN